MLRKQKHIMSSSTEVSSLAEIAQSLRVNVPEEFLCPITLEVMTCPVKSKHGLTFEKSAIEAWLRKSRSSSSGIGTCPLTRQPLTIHDLVPDPSLQQQIMLWVWFQCLPVRLRVIEYSNGICRLKFCEPSSGSMLAGF